MFSGNGPTISLGDPADLRLTGDLTIAGWMNTDSDVRVQHIFGRRNAGCSAIGYAVALDCQGASGTTSNRSSPVQLIFSTGSTAIWSGLSPTPGQWQYFAVVFNSATASVDMYLDGAVVTKGAGGSTLGNPSPADVEIANTHGCNPVLTFRGGLDELRIYDRPLDATEIAQLPTCN